MANFTRIGFGQVEPNQLSAQKTGQIYASLPLDPAVKVLQNGEFMFYDYATGKVTADGKGEPMLVFNEIKIYEDKLALKDFAMIRVGDNYVTNKPAVGRVTSVPIDPKTGKEDGFYKSGSTTTGATITPAHSEWQAGYRMNGIAPRMFKTNIGDVMTTNMVKLGVEYAPGEELGLEKVTNTDGTDSWNTLVLAKGGNVGGIKYVVAKVYTMPDGQPGLKLQRIA